MKTNYQAYEAVLKHYTENQDTIQKMILNTREQFIIEGEFSLAVKDLIQLQDARDFVVAITTAKCLNITGEKSDVEKRKAIMWDMMSAITYAIDCVKLNKGGEI